MLLDRSALVFGRLGDNPGIEGEQSGCRSHIALQGFCHQRFDQRALLADALRRTSLAHRDQLAELGGKIGCQIWAAFGTSLRVTRLPGLEPGRLRRFAVPDRVFFGHG